MVGRLVAIRHRLEGDCAAVGVAQDVAIFDIGRTNRLGRKACAEIADITLADAPVFLNQRIDGGIVIIRDDVVTWVGAGSRRGIEGALAIFHGGGPTADQERYGDSGANPTGPA